MRSSTRRCISVVAMGLAGVWTLGCNTKEGGSATDSVVPPAVSSPTETASADDRVFVLPETDDHALIDSQAAPSRGASGGASFATFALAGSPDDDADGERVSFGIADATGFPTDDVTSAGTEVAVDGRVFHWVGEGENQRVYVGPSPEGITLSMATLNVDEATAVLVLTTAEASGAGGVEFDGRVVPDGWLDTGSSTTLLQFYAGATGSSTPPGGTRDLYGDPARASTPSWDDINQGFGTTLSNWPVAGTDPESEARFNLDGEVEVEIQRGDGSFTTGFVSPTDSEFIEFVVWQDGASWLALSRPVGQRVDALADLVAAVREANPTEIERLTSLREE